MRKAKPPKFKLCLLGESAVGKTSLIRRFVFNQFDDKYIFTIGTKVTKKKVTIQNPKNDGPLDIELLIWDIMGDKSFRQLLQETYFSGVHGIIATCDITRKETLEKLQDWMETVQSVRKEFSTVFLGNKSDLMYRHEVDLNELKSFASGYENAGVYLTSAKTGINVELTFKTISEKIYEKRLLPKL